MTIAGADPDRGTLRIIFRRVGKTTYEMADMTAGDQFAYIVGPLGRPARIEMHGTVICVGCRVEVGGQSRFVCVDGPEFDGHAVDFALMVKRQAAYREQERAALDAYKLQRCKIGLYTPGQGIMSRGG